MSSVTCAPIMCTPSSSSVSASAMTFTKPPVSPLMMALPLAWKGNLAHARGSAGQPRTRPGPPDRGDLRPGVRGARHPDVVDRLHLPAGDGVHGGDALVRRHVGQPQPADDVADGVQVRLGRAHVAIHLDDAPVDDRPGRLEAHRRPCWRARPVATSICSARSSAGSSPFLAHQEPDAVLVRGQGGGLEAGAGHDLDASSPEGALHLRRDLGVLQGHDGRQVLQHGHLRCPGPGSSWRTRRRRHRPRRR